MARPKSSNVHERKADKMKIKFILAILFVFSLLCKGSGLEIHEMREVAEKDRPHWIEIESLNLFGENQEKRSGADVTLAQGIRLFEKSKKMEFEQNVESKLKSSFEKFTKGEFGLNAQFPLSGHGKWFLFTRGKDSAIVSTINGSNVVQFYKAAKITHVDDYYFFLTRDILVVEDKLLWDFLMK